jgi:BirA family biotin operon repressor/biotin-[acetyl-CoA-carboxylase] ligase
MKTFGPGSFDYEQALLAAGLTDLLVVHRQSTGSTNDDARVVASESPLAAAAIVVAETQTRGRGRGSNIWLSPAGSIALTITMPDVLASRLGVLPLGVGSAVVATLRQLGAKAFVKWPNDILIDDRKVCGILCESSLLAGTARVFLGVGINVEAGAVDPELASQATSLGEHGIRPDRPSLVADIALRVVALVRGERSDADIVTMWKAVAVPWWGEPAVFLEGDVEQRVTLIDVNPLGQLVVREASGALRALVSGEVRRIRTVSA